MDSIFLIASSAVVGISAIKLSFEVAVSPVGEMNGGLLRA